MRDTAMWQIKEENGLCYFELIFRNVRIIFTSRRGGNSAGKYVSLNLSYDVGDRKEDVDKNYERLKDILGIRRIVTLNQIHSDRIIVVPQETENISEGDGLITKEKGVYLGIKVADCLPVAIFDSEGTQIGICHIGWRGAISNLTQKMARRFGRVSLPHAVSGKGRETFYSLLPSIQGRCYEVGESVFSLFQKRYPETRQEFLRKIKDHHFLDLRAFVRLSLEGEGLKEYSSLEYCSHCAEDLFYSKRRDGITGRNLALIGLRG